MLTDTEAAELNEKVARAMGWTRIFQPSIGFYWTLPDGDPLRFDDNTDGLPDFCRDAHALGWMVEWAGNQPFDLNLRQGPEGYSASFMAHEPSGFWLCTVQTNCQSFSHALARAIVAYSEALQREGQETKP